VALVEVPVCEGREVSTLIQILLFFIPRFITEDVAVALRPDGDYDLVCAMEDIDYEAGEHYDGVVTIESFTFLGWAWPVGLSSRVEMDVRPWPGVAQ
jgi:hypothetical protein